MKDFELLKRTYPVSRYDRLCDGYDYIIKNSTEEEKKEWGLDINGLQRIIKKDEKYIYQVAKENKAEELKRFIRLEVQVIREAAKYIYPCMPDTANSILEQIGDAFIKKGKPLFPRIDTKTKL